MLYFVPLILTLLSWQAEGAIRSSLVDCLASHSSKLRPLTSSNSLDSTGHIPPSELLVLYDIYSYNDGPNWYWRSDGIDFPYYTYYDEAHFDDNIPWDFGFWSPDDPNINLPAPCAIGSVWEGVECTCNNSTGCHVRSLVLRGHGLVGSISSVAFGDLPYLEHIDMNNNALSGTIPESLFDLQALDFIDFASNMLTGTISERISQLKGTLTFFSIGPNDISGSFPSSFTELTKLEVLNVYISSMTGTIPEDIGVLTQLRYLNLGMNRMTGTIPASISQLTQLTILLIQGFSHLSGSIPSDLGQLTLVDTLSFYGNALTGPLPNSLGNMSSLRRFHVDINFLTGTIPSSLGGIETLQEIILTTNNLFGSLPSSLGQLTLLNALETVDNRLTGTIPDSYGENWPDIEWFTVGSSSYPRIPLHGTIPTGFCHMKKLLLLTILSTELSGTIPECIYNLTNLHAVSLVGGRFVGTMSEAIGNLQSLQMLGLSDNMITGTLPEALFTLPELREIELQYCRGLSGTISEIIGNLANLRRVSLNGNRFYGTLPRSLSSLSLLEICNIEGNHLSGNLDGVFDVSVQKSLRVIALGNNLLEGTLPDDLFDLPNLGTFTAFSNCFDTGALPTSLCNEESANRSLAVLVLDGMRSATNCRKAVFRKGTDIYLPTFGQASRATNKENVATLECLLSPSMPNLEVLHMSGVGLKGQLSSNLTMSDVLYDLSLSHNYLSGSIPSTIQRKQWLRLDLSYNFFNGKLLNDFASANLYGSSAYGTLVDPDNPSLAIEVNRFLVALSNNRLSGRIPEVFLTNISSSDDASSIYDRAVLRASRMTVLDGNMFSCDYRSHKDLPRKDVDWETYQCGSNVFDVAYYSWLACVVIFSVVLLVLLFVVIKERFRTLIAQVVDSHWYESMKNVWQKLQLLQAVAQMLQRRSRHQPCDDILLRNPNQPALPVLFEEINEDDTAVAQELGRLLRSFNRVKLLVYVCLAYCTMVITPTSVYFAYFGGNAKSYTFQYAWAFSFAYKTSWSGGVTMLVQLLLFTFLLACCWSFTDRKPPVSGSPHVTKPKMSVWSSAFSMISDIEADSTKDPRPLRSAAHRICNWSLVLIVEIVLVGGLNFLLVYVSISGTTGEMSLVQLLMVMFDLIWTSEAIGRFATYLEAKTSKQHFIELDRRHSRYFDANYHLDVCEKKGRIEQGQFLIQALIVILHHVLIPALTVLCLSTNCFHDLIIAAPSVQSSYRVYSCNTDIFVGECSDNHYNVFTSNYQPFYMYSYQCSAHILTYLVPPIIYACMVDGFALPIVKLVLSTVMVRFYSELPPSDGKNVSPPAQLPTQMEAVIKYILGTALLEPVAYTTFSKAIKGDRSVNKADLVVAEEDSVMECLEDARGADKLQENVDKHEKLDYPALVPADLGKQDEEGYTAFKHSVADYAGQEFFSSSQFSIEVSIYMLLLLTFGLVFPPAGVAIGLTLLAEVVFTEYILLSYFVDMVLRKRDEDDEEAARGDQDEGTYPMASGSYDTSAHDSNRSQNKTYYGAASCLRAIAVHSRDFEDFMQVFKWPWLCAACWFYSIFVGDTLGAVHEIEGSYWAILLLAIWPVALYFLLETGKYVWTTTKTYLDGLSTLYAL